MSESPALRFEVWSECGTSDARRSRLRLPHGPVDTPVFMPVGTQGALKGLLSTQISGELGVQIMLCNTYHLGLRPGTSVVAELGGIQRMMANERCNVLTDSGGFQMVSLSDLARLSEEGVTFQSPVDGSEMLLTPEKCMAMQNEIGADIMMALDDVVPATCGDAARVELAMERSLRWLARCLDAHRNAQRQSLFGIVQGGLDAALRTRCVVEMTRRFDGALPGYAIGGLSGGESKHEFWRMVHLCAQRLPRNKPRYAMGVGYALDLVVCVALGVDMFDCVFPCRTARFGTALTRAGPLQLKRARFAADFAVIDADCACSTCRSGRGLSRAYLHALQSKKRSTSAQLLTTHNVAFLCALMKDIRAAIDADRFPHFVKAFMRRRFGGDAVQNYPKWAVDAFAAVGIRWT